MTVTNISNVLDEDLRDTDRLLQLHEQAVEAGLIGDAEMDRLNFVSLAEHVLTSRESTRNPCALFIHLLKQAAWHEITPEEEDRANHRIKVHLGRVRPVDPFPVIPCRSIPRLSEDARIVQALRRAVRSHLVRDLFPDVERARPDWTRERWNAAGKELDAVIERSAIPE